MPLQMSVYCHYDKSMVIKRGDMLVLIISSSVISGEKHTTIRLSTFLQYGLSSLHGNIIIT